MTASFTRRAALAALAVAGVGPAFAQAGYPGKPLRLIICFQRRASGRLASI